jgi:hypothetical protein
MSFVTVKCDLQVIFFFDKLPPFTLAGFDLTTHYLASRGGTTGAPVTFFCAKTDLFGAATHSAELSQKVWALFHSTIRTSEPKLKPTKNCKAFPIGTATTVFLSLKSSVYFPMYLADTGGIESWSRFYETLSARIYTQKFKKGPLQACKGWFYSFLVILNH